MKRRNKMNKLIRAEDFFIAIRDDDEINGASFARVVDHLRNMEPVDAVPVVHGRWIIGTGENALMRGFRMCSACGEIIETQYSLYGMLNYCPNCGAKMDLEVTNNG
jgi:hypothetical protein